MPQFQGLKFSSLIVILFFALPAVAQFEVSPDHFDSADKKAPAIAHKATAHRASGKLVRRSAGLKSATSNAQQSASAVGVVNPTDKASIGASRMTGNAGAHSKPKTKRQLATTSSWTRPGD